MNISTGATTLTSWPKSFVLILLSCHCSWFTVVPNHATCSLQDCRSRSLAAEHNFPLSAWRGLGEGGTQRRWRSRRGEARGWDREVGGEGRGGDLNKMKETAVYKWQASTPPQRLFFAPSPSPTCSDVALCGHRTASKRQARRGEGRILKETASLSSANTTASETRAQSASSTLCTLLNPPAKSERKK